MKFQGGKSFHLSTLALKFYFTTATSDHFERIGYLTHRKEPQMKVCTSHSSYPKVVRNLKHYFFSFEDVGDVGKV